MSTPQSHAKSTCKAIGWIDVKISCTGANRNDVANFDAQTSVLIILLEPDGKPSLRLHQLVGRNLLAHLFRIRRILPKNTTTKKTLFPILWSEKPHPSRTETSLHWKLARSNAYTSPLTSRAARAADTQRAQCSRNRSAFVNPSGVPQHAAACPRNNVPA